MAGGRVAPLPKDTVMQRLCTLHGPRTNSSEIWFAICRAAEWIQQGRVDWAQWTLDNAALPAVIGDGAALMRAVAQRLGITIPRVLTDCDHPRRWQPKDVAAFAPAFDAHAEAIAHLRKVFDPAGWNPDKHPRWPAGQSNGGEFRSSDADTSATDSAGIADQAREVQTSRSGTEGHPKRGGVPGRTQSSSGTTGSNTAGSGEFAGIDRRRICVDRCYHILERYSYPGDDRKDRDFYRCYDECMRAIE